MRKLRRSCRAAAIDPFFGAESMLAAELCVRNRIPYVTIDARHDSALHQHAAVNVISQECTAQYDPAVTPEEIMEMMKRETDGLTILTQGCGDMLFGRKGEPTRRMPAFRVPVRSTLGAGDTFKAGCVYALLHKMRDAETVRFAAACAAAAVMRFPLPLNPPMLPEVRALMNGQAG